MVTDKPEWWGDWQKRPLANIATENGVNSVKVEVSPSTLYHKIELEIVDPGIASAPVSLTSAVQTIQITGFEHGTTELVAKLANGFGDAARLHVDVRRRLPTQSLAIFRVKRPFGPEPVMPFSNQQILDSLNDVTWGPQANAFFEIASGPDLVEVDYDLNDNGVLDMGGSEPGIIMQSVLNGEADIQVYIVEKMNKLGAQTTTANGNFVFIREDVLLSVLAHEIGHALGIPEEGHDIVSSGNVMSAPQIPDSTQIRRLDWLIVNP